MVQRVIDYAVKVFADAEYGAKNNKAKSLRAKVKRLANSAKRLGDLAAVAKEFTTIDPEMLSDLDEYNAMAEAVAEGLVGTKLTSAGVKGGEVFSIDEVSDYTIKALDEQDQAMRDSTAEKINSLFGDIDTDGMSYEDMLRLMDALSEDPNMEIAQEKIDAISKAANSIFSAYAAAVDDMLSKGIDPNTGLPLDISESKKNTVRKFMQMDLKELSVQDAMRAINALNNFMTNQSTASMDAILGAYNGSVNSKKLDEQNVRAKPIKMWGSKLFGGSFYELFASVPIFFERVFKGVTAGARVSRMMGVTSLVNNKAEALSIVNRITNAYIDRFGKTKPNGKSFNHQSNIVERGIIGHLGRNVFGTASEQKKNFDERKKLISDSVLVLRKSGLKKDAELADAIEEAYNKIVKNSENIDDVKKASAKENIDAVDFWKNEWAKKYEKLKEVSLSVYNTVLGNDVDFVPDRYLFTEASKRKKKEDDPLEITSTFFNNSNAINKKKTAGSLMETNQPKGLRPDDGMFLNLSFDTNNSQAMLDAMIDIMTAADVRQIDAFIKSKSFDNIFPNVSDRQAMIRRMADLVSKIKNKRIVDDKVIKDVVKAASKMSQIGVTVVLAGPTQTIKQTVPIMMQTIMQTGGTNMAKGIFDAMSQAAINFVNNSGRAIVNRGVESVAELESLNNKMEKEASTVLGKSLQWIENVNKTYLKWFLSNPDIAIARASWLAYYRQYMNKNGMKGPIDWATHEMNEDAADYAQMMIDRNQNISDKDLAGSWFNSGKPLKELITKIVLPFATFRINQTARLNNDISVLASRTASREDKWIATKSFVGTGVEMAAFRTISIGLSYYVYYTIAQMIRGEEEDEEKKQKKWDNLIKGSASSAVSDLFSPLPPADEGVKHVANILLGMVQGLADVPDDEQYKLFAGNTKQTFSSMLGTLGIVYDKAAALKETYDLAFTGEYTDDFGNKKYISQSNMDLLQKTLPLQVVFSAGLLPAPEALNVINSLVKIAKKEAKTEKAIEKENAYGEYDTIEKLKEGDPKLYDELSKKGGALYDLRESQEKGSGDRGAKPFRGMTEENFRKKFPQEWKEQYGPGTEYRKFIQSDKGREYLREEAKKKREDKAKKAKKKLEKTKKDREDKMEKAIKDREKRVRKAREKYN
jgi:hypothetical protein